MTSTELQGKAIEALVIINAAIKNIRLYPPASAMVTKSIERVLPPLEIILQAEETLTIAESEKNLLIFGEPLSEKEQQKPQVTSFIATLLDFGIKSLDFKKGLAIEELETFLQTLSRKPEEIKSEGGLQAVLSNSHMPHIVLDEKVYVAVDQDSQIVAGMDIKDEDIVHYITGGQAASEQDMEKVKELARDSGWVTSVFEAGIQQVAGSKGAAVPSEVARTVHQLVQTFDTITDSDSQTVISKHVARTIAGQDDDTIAAVLSQNYQGQLGDRLFEQIADQVPDDQFERLVLKMKKNAAAGAGDPAGRPSAARAYQKLATSQKGQRLSQKIESREKQNAALKQRKILQLKARLSNLLKGDLGVLNDPDLLASLPNTVAQLLAKNKTEITGTIIEKLVAGLASGACQSQPQIFRTLQSISQKLPPEEREALAGRTVANLLQWVKTQATLIPEYEKACDQIKSQAMRLLKKRQFEQFNSLVEIFNDKLTGKQAADKQIRQHAGVILREIGSDHAWDLFLNKFSLLEEILREPAIRSQVLLGVAALERLLDALESSTEMPDRVRLVRILTEIGRPAVKKICARIERGGAWYYLRNLVALLGKVGRPEHAAILKPLLNHEDFRIQREALNSVYSIGGEERGPLLLAALPAASVKAKTSIVAMLGALKYQNSAASLLEILNSKPVADAGESELLFEKTCVALGKTGSLKAVPALEKISQGKSSFKKTYPPKVREAARDALILIHKTATRKPEPPSRPPENLQPPKPTAPQPVERVGKSPAEADQRDARIDKYVADGDTDAAVKLLFEMLVEFAKQKNFKKAEELRDRLYDVDAMALTEIVKAGEIIEQEKSEAIDQDHLDVWPDLYEKLTSEEANTLFHAMEEVSYETNQAIFEQGRENHNLYFITRGRLKLIYRDGERETLLKTLAKGDLAGYATFFTISMCTTSLITLSSVKMSVLSKSTMEQWADSCPALESKLQDYCLKLEKSRDMVKKKGLDRRKQQRFNVKGKILIQLLNREGQAMGKPFKGSFSDISEGGLSFYIITSKQETARTLLGRRLGLKFLIPTRATPLKTFQIGTVICVNYHLQNDYSIHVSFDDELPAGIAGVVLRLKNLNS